MSYTTVYSIDKDGDVIEHSDIGNAHRICMLIWQIMFELYNDYFIDEVERPEWMPDDHKLSFSDLQMSGDMKPFWDLYKHEDVLYEHRLLHTLTFDRVIILKENFPEIIKALENFIETMTGDDFKEFFGKYDFNGLRELIEIIKEIQDDEDYVGFALCISLIASHWNKYDEDGQYTPYNTLKDKNHQDIFNDIFKKDNNEVDSKTEEK